MDGYSRPPERDDTDVVGSRIAAQIADQFLVLFVAIFSGIVLGAVGSTAGGEAGSALTGIYILVLLGFIAGYFFVLEGLWDGQTLGKKLFGIKVVKEDGSECDITASILRNLLRIIDGAFYYAVGFIFMASSDKRQRIGDRLANTAVVREE